MAELILSNFQDGGAEEIESAANIQQGRGSAALLTMSPAQDGVLESREAAPNLLALRRGSKRAALVKTPHPMDRSAVESMRYVDFAIQDAHKKYRPVLIEGYNAWQEFNVTYFSEQLTPPHLSIDFTPPNKLGLFKTLTGYGGRNRITIDERIVTGRRKFVKKAWPAPGNRLFFRDILLQQTVLQYLAEVKGFDDEENGKYGEACADVCSRLGECMGLPRVYTRRRVAKDAGKPLANLWPINVRPAGYYLGDVVPPCQNKAKKLPEPRGFAGAMSLLCYLFDAGQFDKLATIIRREAAQVREHGCTAKPASEKDEASWFNPAWLDWNNGCIRLLLHAICNKRLIDLVPLLADALELAGCRNELFLMHCRMPVRHNQSCWVLKQLRGALR